MQNNLETTLEQLISIPSVSNNPVTCAEIIEFVRAEIADLGLFLTESGDVANPWLIATTKDTKEPGIMLAAHLDVVPAPTELFTMQKHAGKLTGRGVYDMKLAAACYLEFLKAHADTLKDLDIGFLFTTDEEIGGASILDILEAGWRPGVVFIPDGGGGWHIEERAKGFYDVEITARGTAAHGSRPWEGKNAIHRLMEVLQILRQSFPDENPQGPTLAINKIRGGEVVNQIPDYASAQIDFRTFDKHDIAIYRAQVEQLAEKYDLEISMVIEGAPVNFDKSAPAVQDFLRSIEAQTGEAPHYTESFGGTDARHFAAYDIPSIIVVPTGGGRHALDEWLLAEDLGKYYQLIERWLITAPKANSSMVATSPVPVDANTA